MEDVEFQEIMEESLNEVILQIHRIYANPSDCPITLFTTYSQKDSTDTKHSRIYASLASYFLGSFESLIFTKLNKKYNYTLYNSDTVQYLKNFESFFELFKNEVGKIDHSILSYFEKHTVNFINLKK